MSSLIRIEGLKKAYDTGAVRVQALRGIDLEIAPGDFVAIMGASGSGKSTLMNILGCLDSPTAGRYWLEGVQIDTLRADALADVRNQMIGFVFQTYNLLPRVSARENVELPLLYNRKRRITDSHARAIRALSRVGLAERVDHEPSQMSGGEQQRVAIARALVTEPSLILADEPTGNLDTRNTVDVLTVFEELNEQGITIVIVTHEDDVAHYTKRIVRLRDGRKVIDEPVSERRSARADLADLPPTNGDSQ